jgi:hypothetical protein
MKIIITGGKSAQSLKVLKAFVHDQVLLADYGEAPAFSSGQYTFISLGEKNDAVIAHNLLSTCLDHEADYLLPLHPSEIEAVASSLTLFEEFNIHVLLPAAGVLPLYYKHDGTKSNYWAVYDKGELVYTSAPWSPEQEQPLNGVFYITAEEDTVTLFTID